MTMERWDPHEARFRTVYSAAGRPMDFNAKPPLVPTRVSLTVVDLDAGNTDTRRGPPRAT